MMILVRSHTLMEIDHEIISAVILPSVYSRRVVVSYKGKCVHKVPANRLVKFDQEIKMWLGELTFLTLP